MYIERDIHTYIHTVGGFGDGPLGKPRGVSQMIMLNDP